MRIVDLNRGTPIKWNHLAVTTRNSSTWGFDSLRLYHPNINTKIGIWTITDLMNDPNMLNPTYGIEKFHSGGGWTANTFEHDFEFDLSGNIDNTFLYVMISGIPKGAEFQR